MVTKRRRIPPAHR